ncbi:hypothetical protein BKA66DRAFT_470539 [Pyrenochaeta sp. MPI-SDFR-AT-0127]|nr:hypothetical protein BKA66DRAFT_470539 [Pyrenochaeta sp. MPI-SDFR-AT-0127]
MDVARHFIRRQTAVSVESLTPEQIAINKSGSILATVATLFAVTTAVVLLRFYVRIRMVKTFGNDDWAMMFALLCCIVTFVCTILRIDNGLGRDVAVTLTDVSRFRAQIMMTYIEAIVVLAGLSAVKVSVAFCLLRFTITRSYQRVLFGSIIFIVVFTLACCAGLIWQCIPVDAAWNMYLKPPTGTARCMSTRTFINLALMNSVFNIVTDACFAALPMPLIYSLHLNRRTKFSLALVLSLGWFSCAAGIVKIYKQTQFDYYSHDQDFHDSFFTWYFVEFTVGIVSASLPPLKPLFAPLLGYVTSEIRRTVFGSRPSHGNTTGYQNTTKRWDNTLPLDQISNANSDEVRLYNSTNGAKNMGACTVRYCGDYPRSRTIDTPDILIFF